MNEIMKTGPWTVVIQKGLQSSLFCQHCYSTYCIHDRHSSSTVCILIHLTFTRTLEVGTETDDRQFVHICTVVVGRDGFEPEASFLEPGS